MQKIFEQQCISIGCVPLAAVVAISCSGDLSPGRDLGGGSLSGFCGGFCDRDLHPSPLWTEWQTRVKKYLTTMFVYGQKIFLSAFKKKVRKYFYLHSKKKEQTLTVSGGHFFLDWHIIKLLTQGGSLASFDISLLNWCFDPICYNLQACYLLTWTLIVNIQSQNRINNV